MQRLSKFAKAGNRVISGIVVVLMLMLFAYGGYSLWRIHMIYNAASPDYGFGAKTITFAELARRNPDVKGWLTVAGTHIDYPVVQGDDDMTYINKNALGDFEMSGAIFLDAENSADFSDAYNLTFGHHMAGGLMFGDLDKFTKKRFLKKHHRGTLYTTGACYRLEIVAAAEIDAYDTRFYNVSDKKTAAALPQLMKNIGEVALAARGDLSADRPVFAMSTCHDDKTDGRIVVFAKMTPVKNLAKAHKTLRAKRVKVSG